MLNSQDWYRSVPATAREGHSTEPLGWALAGGGWSWDGVRVRELLVLRIQGKQLSAVTVTSMQGWLWPLCPAVPCSVALPVPLLVKPDFLLSPPPCPSPAHSLEP